MQSTRHPRFEAVAAQMGHRFGGEIKIGGHCVPVLGHGEHVFVSGQIPRVGDTILVVGRVGSEVSLAEARLVAQVFMMRAMALLRQSLGSLEAITLCCASPWMCGRPPNSRYRPDAALRSSGPISHHQSPKQVSADGSPTCARTTQDSPDDG